MNRDRIIRNSQPAAGRALPLRSETAPVETRDTQVVVENAQRPAMNQDELRKLFAAELAELYEAERAHAREAAERDAQARAEAKFRESARKLEEEYRDRLAELDEQRASISQALKQLAGAETDLREHRDGLLRELEPVVVEIALAAVLKILGQAVKEQTVIRRVVNTQLSKASKMRPVRVRISAQDFELLAAQSEMQDDVVAGLFAPDAALAPGEIFIETEHGTIDAGLDRQIAEFRKLLTRTYRSIGD